MAQQTENEKKAQRRFADFYETPAWVVHRLLERLPLKVGNWLEAGAGDGALIKAVEEKVTGIRWTALELREQCRPVLESLPCRPEVIITSEFVGSKLPDNEKPLHGHRFDVCIANPPFSLALEFVQEARRFAETVVMLLPVRFESTKHRVTFMGTNYPDKYLVPERISFTGRGCDTVNHAWYVWGPESFGRRSGTSTTLDKTPDLVRAAAARAAREKAAQIEKQLRDAQKPVG